MVALKILNLKNEVVGEEKVDAAIFKAPFKPFLLHDYVVMQRRALRQGTHSTKTRAEVSGTGKKPFRQKGTGNARQGTLIGPHQPGGGIQFGPKPRDYSSRLNKKAKMEAVRVALSQKNFEGKLAVVDKFDIASGKSKDAAKALAPWSKKSVLVVGEFSETTMRSVRNITFCKAILPAGLNVFDILHHDQVLIVKSSLGAINDKFKVVRTRKEAA